MSLTDMEMELGVTTSKPLPVNSDSAPIACSTCPATFKATDEGCSDSSLMCADCMKTITADLERVQTNPLSGFIVTSY